MNEEHSMQEEELAEGVVGSAHGLSSFFASDANADVGLSDHRAVVGPVANRHSYPGTVSFAKCDDVSFLLRRDAAADHRGSQQAHLEKRVGAVLVVKGKSE